MKRISFFILMLFSLACSNNKSANSSTQDKVDTANTTTCNEQLDAGNDTLVKRTALGDWTYTFSSGKIGTINTGENYFLLLNC